MAPINLRFGAPARIETMTLRLSEEEKAALTAAADKAGRTPCGMGAARADAGRCRSTEGSIMAAGAPASPFVWGPGGEAMSPEQVARQRRIAEALMANQQQPTGFWSGLTALGNAAIARALQSRADNAEKAGQQSVSDAFSRLTPGSSFSDLTAVATNPYANEGQRAVVEALLKRNLDAGAPGKPLEINNQLVDPSTYQVLGDYRDPAKPAESWQPVVDPAERAKYGIGADDQRAYQVNGATNELEAVGGTGTTVNMPAAESKYDSDVGGYFAKRYGGIMDDADAARSTLANLDVMEAAMNDESFYSGIGNEQVMTLKRLGAALGINPDGVTSMETFNAAAKSGVLNQLGGSLGAGIANGDRDFITSSAPGLDNSPRGNMSLLAIQAKLAQRKLEIANLADQYISEHKRLDAGWPSYLSDYAEANPMFPKGPTPPVGAAGQQAGGAAPAQPASQPNLNMPLPTISSPGEYDALQSGAHFLDPQGNERVKP